MQNSSQLNYQMMPGQQGLGSYHALAHFCWHHPAVAHELRFFYFCGKQNFFCFQSGLAVWFSAFKFPISKLFSLFQKTDFNLTSGCLYNIIAFQPWLVDKFNKSPFDLSASTFLEPQNWGKNEKCTSRVIEMHDSFLLPHCVGRLYAEALLEYASTICSHSKPGNRETCIRKWKFLCD